MIRAAAVADDGTRTILLGLTPANVRRLRAGEPIRVDGDELGEPGLRIIVVFGQTERAITADIRAAGVVLPDDTEDVLRKVEREHRTNGTTP